MSNLRITKLDNREFPTEHTTRLLISANRHIYLETRGEQGIDVVWLSAPLAREIAAHLVKLADEIEGINS